MAEKPSGVEQELGALPCSVLHQASMKCTRTQINKGADSKETATLTQPVRPCMVPQRPHAKLCKTVCDNGCIKHAFKQHSCAQLLCSVLQLHMLCFCCACLAFARSVPSEGIHALML